MKANAGVSDLPKLSDAIHNDLATLYREEIAKSVRGGYQPPIWFSAVPSFRASDVIFLICG